MGLYRRLLAPLMFLFFLVPTGYFLVPPLQSITADIAVAGLRLARVPLFRDGYLIEIPAGSFEIAEACAGLRFLIATSAFSSLLAVVMYRGWRRRIYFIILAIAVAILANGLRAFGIIFYAHLSGSAAAAVADHILYGWLFFSIVTSLIIGLGILLAKQERREAPAPPIGISNSSPGWRALAIPVAAIFAIAGPAYAAWRNNVVSAELPLVTASPPVAAPWQKVDTPADWRPVVHGADNEFLEVFKSGRSASVTRYLGLYRLRATANRLTLSDNRLADGRRWRLARQRLRRVKVAGENITVTESEIFHGSNPALVWSFYVVDDKIIAGMLEAKLYQLRATLSQKRSLGALVMLESGADTGADPSDLLGLFLASSQPLTEYVAELLQNAEHTQ